MAYYSVEPWGSKLESHRDALTCATIANAGLFSSAPSLLKSKQFHPEDFMVTASGEKKLPHWQEQKLKAQRVLTANKMTCSGGCK